MIRPDGYFATEAKLSTANGSGPAYQVKNRIYVEGKYGKI